MLSKYTFLQQLLTSSIPGSRRITHKIIGPLCRVLATANTFFSFHFTQKRSPIYWLHTKNGAGGFPLCERGSMVDSPDGDSGGGRDDAVTLTRRGVVVRVGWNCAGSGPRGERSKVSSVCVTLREYFKVQFHTA